MSVPCKIFIWLIVFYSYLSATLAQNNNWMLGEWKGTGVIPGSAYSTVFARTLIINTVNKDQFTGKLIQEVMDNKGTRIEKEVRGSITNTDIKIIAGRTLYVKQPSRGFWADCSSCKTGNTRISVSSDSLILTSETRLCGNYCDGYTTYYKRLADFDTAMQRKLVQLFGSPLLVKIFKPVTRHNEIAAHPEMKPASKSDTLQQQSVTTGAAMRNPLPYTAKRKDPVNDTTQSQLRRTNKVIATYNVSDPVIKVELFDNGEIDGDTVTVYHNKQKIIDRKLLGIKPIIYSVTADAQNRVHEFILVADNLGRIPPNTALMRITAGSKTYELFTSTTLNSNVSVIIIYSGG